jgi:hypothetical protein
MTRRSVLFALLGAACLVAIWSFATWGQVIDASACERSCNEHHTAYVTACGTHDNPVECDADCRDQLEGCQEQCD